MLDHVDAATIPLPKHWSRHVRSAILHVIALTRYAAAQVRGWAVNSPIARLRLTAQLDRARQEMATRLTVRKAADAGQRQARRPRGTRGHVP